MGTTVFERRRPPASVIEHSLAGTQQRVFWLDDLADEAGRTRPKLTGERIAQLAIVGGGYTGLWTAVLAKQRNPDARVVLVEAKTIGWAASGRNGGFCEASLTHGRENGLSRWPDELATLDRLGLENLDAIEASEAELGMDFEFERNGALGVAVEPHQIDWLEDLVADAAARGDDTVRYLDESELRSEVDSPTYLAGVWERRTSAILHPAKLACGTRPRRRGARRRDLRELAGAPHRHPRLDGRRDRRHRWRPSDRRAGGARDERVPEPPEAQHPDDRAGVRLRAHDRAALRRATHRDRLVEPAGQSATSRTSSTTTACPATIGSSSAATTPSTTTGGACASSTKSVPSRSSGSRATSSRRSRSSRD